MTKEDIDTLLARIPLGEDCRQTYFTNGRQQYGPMRTTYETAHGRYLDREDLAETLYRAAGVIP